MSINGPTKSIHLGFSMFMVIILFNAVTVTSIEDLEADTYYTIEEIESPQFNIVDRFPAAGSTWQDLPDCPGARYIEIKYQIPVVDKNGNKRIEDFYISRLQEDAKQFYDTSGNVIGKAVRRSWLNCKEQDDPSLVEEIKQHYLDPPAMDSKPNLSSLNFVGDGQPLALDQRYFFESVKGGFFVEAGAFNGDSASTTAYFEMRHGWTGLLVEPLPVTYSELRSKQRRAWSVQTCLSPSTRPQDVNFSTSGSSNVTMAGIVSAQMDQDKTELYQCMPLFSLLLALGNPRVDYLSLDVEGAELDVLNTLPWDRVDIRAMSVEVEFADEFEQEETGIQSLLERHGFFLLDTISRDQLYVQMPRPDLVSLGSGPKHLSHGHLWQNGVIGYNGNMSPAVTMKTVMTRQFYPHNRRICVYLNIAMGRLEEHCKTQFPRDFFKSRPMEKLPPCVRRTDCPADFASLVRTVNFSAPWRTQLSSSCMYFEY